MVTSCSKGGAQELLTQLQIVETCWQDHSLGALSDGAIRFSMQPFLGK
jgi:hypothetical protein